MVCQLNCDCEAREEIIINSITIFKEITKFFDMQVQKGIFIEEQPVFPFYTWKEKERSEEWFATKWYRCKVCGCLWEFNYPDFPAKGFVRKFPDGVYRERGF